MVVVTLELEDNIAEQLIKEAHKQNTTLEQFLVENAVKILGNSPSEFRFRLNQILEEDHELLSRLA